ncbi:hypothetical protein [Vibrio sp. 03-59-1]|uniref:hypothetical protein n=1 Tax=Vibrio TaxID=662 RepID=UPI0014937CA6|nr:hypothetical protein [Vibrio sp. 03-59-1]NOH82831.1 hypothetical protein [Vibrio sp. 03-59-1]
MDRIGRSKAYDEGLRSSTCCNPYNMGTAEFNDFERGWVQRIKRGGGYSNRLIDFSQALTDQYFPRKRKSQIKVEPKFNAYANAKGK